MHAAGIFTTFGTFFEHGSFLLSNREIEMSTYVSIGTFERICAIKTVINGCMVVSFNNNFEFSSPGRAPRASAKVPPPPWLVRVWRKCRGRRGKLLSEGQKVREGGEELRVKKQRISI